MSSLASLSSLLTLLSGLLTQVPATTNALPTNTGNQLADISTTQTSTTPGSGVGVLRSVLSGTPMSNTGNYLLGYSFVPTTSGTITQLALRMPDTLSHTVILSSGGSVLSSAVIIANTNNWVSAAITPIAVVAGQTYVVSTAVSGKYYYESLNEPTTVNGVTVTNALYSTAGSNVPTGSSAIPTGIDHNVALGEVDVTFVSGGGSPVVTAPTISSFSASPTTITAGQSSILSWNTTNATSLSINGSLVSGTSLTITPTQTTTYTLTATNSGGSATASVTVMVNPVVVTPPPDTIPPSAPGNLTATAKSQTEVDLSWSASTDNVSVAGYQIFRNSTVITTLSANTLTYADTSVSPGTSYTYSVKATDAAGNVSAASNSQVVTTPVIISVPTISSFSASPTTITAGQSATLSWSQTGATSLSISNIGTVSGNSVSVTPSQTTTYTLTASNSGGSATASVTVTVNPAVITPPPSTSSSFTFLAPTNNQPLSSGINYITFLPTGFTPSNSQVRVTITTAAGGATAYTNQVVTGNGSIYYLGMSTSYLPGQGSYVITATANDSSGKNYSGSVNTYYGTQTTPPPVTTPAPSISSFSANPTSLTSGQSATLSWSQTGATSLSVNNGVGAVTGQSSASVSPTQTTTYTLTATNSSGSTTASVTVTVMAVAPTKDVTSPSVPTNFSASVLSSSSISLSWNASVDPTVSGQTTSGLAGYKIYRNGVQVGTPTTNSYIDTGLSANTTYSYTVAAYDAAGNVSAQSSAASATTQAQVATQPTINFFSASPTSITTGQSTALSWTTTGATSVMLNGTSVSGTSLSVSPTQTTTYTLSAMNLGGSVTQNVTVTVNAVVSTKFTIGQRVQTTASLNVRSTASTGGALVSTEASGTLGTVTGGPTNANGYNWWDIKYDNGITGWSVEDYLQSYTVAVDTQPPSVPTNLAATATSASQINVSWSASTDNVGVMGYKVFQNGTLLATTTATSFSSTGLTASTLYSYTVAAYDAAGNVSAQSSAASATTQAQVVTTGPINVQTAISSAVLYGSETYLPDINAPNAWNITTGSSNVTVALIDTGVDGKQPALASKLVSGWDIYDNVAENSPSSGLGITSDITGHGTWEAGIIAPTYNNGVILGLCWGCMMMPVRVSDANGNATDANIAAGITWAADHGAKIINLGYADVDSSAVMAAAQYATNKGSLVVAPIGNAGNKPNSPVGPAPGSSTFDSSTDNPYILTVSGVNFYNPSTIWSLSNTGNNVDLAAPDSATYTTVNTGGFFGETLGTGAASAIVSGVAGLIWSVNPSLTVSQVRTILEQSATQEHGAQGSQNSTFGYGLVNAYKAVLMASGNTKGNTTTTIVGGLFQNSTAGQLTTLTATVSPAAATGTVTFVDSVLGNLSGPVTLATVPVNNGVATFSTSALSAGSGSIQHTITATYNGNSSYNGSTGMTYLMVSSP